MSWRPLLVGEQAHAAWLALDHIARALCQYETEDITLMPGNAGLAVFFHLLSKARPHQGYEEEAAKRFSLALNGLPEQEIPPGLFTGFAGVAFAAELLFPEQDNSEAVDEALAEYLDQESWEDPYDLNNGLVGLGVYALGRPQTPTTALILRRILGHLEALHEEHPQGVTWRIRPTLLAPNVREEHPEGLYDLSLSHGVAGVISLLARMLSADVEAARVGPLLEGAVLWLLSQKGAPKTFQGRKPRKVGASYFANRLDPRTRDFSSARTAWCYGDPGIACALWDAGEAADKREWREEALRLAHASALLPIRDTLIEDVGVCHGSAGLAHILNHFYQQTNEETFANAARFYLTETLSGLRDKGGIGGVVESVLLDLKTGETGYQPSACLLNGAVGVGLVLLSALTDEPPRWDRCLLLS